MNVCMIGAVGNDAMLWIISGACVLLSLFASTSLWNHLNYGLRRWYTEDGIVLEKKVTYREAEEFPVDGDIVKVDARMFYSCRIACKEGWEDTIWMNEATYDKLLDGMTVRFRYRIGRFHGKRLITLIV